MQRFISLIFCIFLVTIAIAQDRQSLVGHSLPALKQINQQEEKVPLFAIPTIRLKQTTSHPTHQHPTFRSLSVPILYSYEELAPFCKLEVKMEKVVKMPIKFRLGSVDYVDYLEGKRDWY